MSLFVVGVAGGTGSGKTTLCRALVRRLGSRALHLRHDDYYLDAPDPAHHDFDRPEALDSARLAADLDALAATGRAEVPIYDFAAHRRVGTRPVVAAPVVLVDGILVLAVPELVDRLDLKVYVDAPEVERVVRRLRRDVAERGRTVRGVLRQLLDTVLPAHDRYVAPTRRLADLVVDGTAPVEQAADRVLAALVANGVPLEER